MSAISDRLKQRRLERGLESAKAAAEAMGVNVFTYTQHENGTRDMSVDVLARYAQFMRASLDWLVFGKVAQPLRLPGSGGEVRTARTIDLPLLGKVGAGAIVDMPDSPDANHPLDDLRLDLDNAFALTIEGDSQKPRYMPGDKVLVEGTPRDPRQLIGEEVVVQVEGDGRRLIKRLHRGMQPDRFTLTSLAADPEQNVRILAAWRVLAILPG